MAKNGQKRAKTGKNRQKDPQRSPIIQSSNLPTDRPTDRRTNGRWRTNNKQRQHTKYRATPDFQSREEFESGVRQLYNSLSQPFPPNLQDIIKYKPKELRSWNIEKIFTPHNKSHVICHLLHVTCHVSQVMCHVSHITFFFERVMKIFGGGSVIKRAYPIRYIPSLLIHFLCTVCTASCRM